MVGTLGLSCSTACVILVLQPGIEPPSSALQGRFLNHWTNRKISKLLFLKGHQSHWIRFCPKDLFFTLITSLISKSSRIHRSCGEDFSSWIWGGAQFIHDSCAVAAPTAEARTTSALQGPGNLGVLWHPQEGNGTENLPIPPSAPRISC